MMFRRLAVILSILVLAACDSGSLFLAQEASASSVSVSTIDSGATVEPGSSVPVRIERSADFVSTAENTDSVLVELLDLDGELLAEIRYESVDQATEPPPIELPSLSDGIYTLRSTYFDGTDVLYSHDVFFFMVSGDYSIRGLSTYPASARPEADSLLSALLKIPDASDPYLEWWVDGSMVASGPLSETGSTIAIAAPGSQGVYPVRVDLYPVWDARADYALIAATESLRTELIVSNSPVASSHDLGPDDGYFSLYHLRGSRNESGARSTLFPALEFTARPSGWVVLAAHDDVFGYRLDGFSSLTLPGVVWPLWNGALTPVSFEFRILADRLDGIRTLLSMNAGATGIGRIVLDEDGRAGVRLAGWDDTVWSELPVVEPGRAALLALALIPQVDRLAVRFYSSGVLVSSASTTLPEILQNADIRVRASDSVWSMIEGESRLGDATDGFAGIIDEFGVARIDPYAGAVEWADEPVTLLPSASLRVPALVANQSGRVRVGLRSGERVILATEDGEWYTRLILDASEDEPLEFDVTRESGATVAYLRFGDRVEEIPATGDASVVLVVSVPDDAAPVDVSSITTEPAPDEAITTEPAADESAGAEAP